MRKPELEDLARTGWLHFYQMRHAATSTEMPRLLCRGEGIRVFDDTGRGYIDGVSGAFCVNVGYGRSSILDQMHKAASSIHFASPFLAGHPSGIHLSCRLSEMAAALLGQDARVFFVNSGSEAVETAVKLARSYAARRGRPCRDIVSRTHSYHGTTLGALSVSGLELMRKDFGPLLPGFRHIPYPNCKRCDLKLLPSSCGLACLDILNAQTDADEAPCAVLIETIQTSGGLILPPVGYLDSIQSFCRRTGSLLIVDEVITGFGRIGRWFSSEEFGLEPDIIVCAKGLTSGYASLGAVIARKGIADAHSGDSDELWFAHGATFGGGPGATAAALENISIIEKEGLLENAIEQGAYLADSLRAALDTFPNAGEVYGKGLLLGVDLLDDDGNLVGSGDERQLRLTEALFRNGLILRMFNSRRAPFLQVAPPLSIRREECDLITEIVAKSIAQTFYA